MDPTKTYNATLCWDCSRSYKDKCPWAKSYTPIEGWDAQETHSKENDSYLVKSCPLFVRDAGKGGQLRYRNNKFYKSTYY